MIRMTNKKKLNRNKKKNKKNNKKKNKKKNKIKRNQKRLINKILYIYKVKQLWITYR